MADDTEIEGSDLSAIIADEIRMAEADTSIVTESRTTALEYLRGEMIDTPPRPNGSKQTSRDFADTVSWILPGIVRLFTASDQMVQYTKVKAEDDTWAREATEYTNYTFFRESEGYRVLYNATYDSLTQGDGLVSCYWEPERFETKTHKDLTDMEFAALREEGWEFASDPPKIMPGKPRIILVPDALGEAVEGERPTYTARMKKVSRPGRICDITCDPNNLRVNSMATTIEGARFTGYRHDDKTRSDLMEMADDYDWDQEAVEAIKTLASFRSATSNGVSDARNGSRVRNDSSPVKSGEFIELWECYVYADKDGDGVAELYQAWWAGNAGSGKLMGFEEWDGDVPFTTIPCYPVPHRFDSESVFDRTADIQRVKTVLTRAMLDNSYAVGMPMREVEKGSVENPEILMSPKFGGLIWKKAGSNPIINHETPPIVDKLLLAMQYMDEMSSKRTGVSRQTMALDPEALQNQTATANQNSRDASYSQIELIGRNQAELGWTRHFAIRMKLAIKHQKIREIPTKQEEPQTGPDGQPLPPTGFKKIDPTKWDPNMAVLINTGLGTGSRDRDMSMLNVVQQGQIAMAATMADRGLTDKALEFLPKIRKTAVQLAESSGLKDPEDYYPEITDEDVEKFKQQAAAAAQQPSPQEKIELAKQQGAKDLKAMDVQVAGQEAELRAKSDVIKNQAELQADLQTKEADRQNAVIIETVKQRHALDAENAKLASMERIKAEERQLEREKMAMNYQLEQDKMANAATIGASKPKPNGDARQ